MRNRRKLFVLLASVLIAGGALLWFASEKEPSFDGRSLSEWIAIGVVDYAYRPPRIPSPARQQEAADAIRHIGADALPFLLSWIKYEPSTWRIRVISLTTKLPKWLRTSWPIKSLQLADEEARRPYHALAAFSILGALAAPAVPDLIRQINEGGSQYKVCRAMKAVAYIGSEGAPALISILSSPGQQTNSCWTECIMIMGPNARPLVPLVVQRLQSTNDQIAFQSAEVLKDFKLDSNLAVPALTKALNDPRAIVQFRAAETLGEFGKVARSALPALTNALSDPNPSVRLNASNAIWQITTAPATNAPPR